MQSTGLWFGAFGAGALGLAGLMHAERLPRNGLVGMRTGATMASDAAWNAGHHDSAWAVALAGVVLLGTAGWLLLDRRASGAHRGAVLGTSIGLAVALVVIGGVQADRAARDMLHTAVGGAQGSTVTAPG